MNSDPSSSKALVPRVKRLHAAKSGFLRLSLIIGHVFTTLAKVFHNLPFFEKNDTRVSSSLICVHTVCL